MCDGEQFSLQWNNFHNNLSNGFVAMLEDEELVDVTLSAEGQFIKAHKMVLSICSPYFKELFKMNPCKHPVIILKDVPYTQLEDILEFIYKGEVKVNKEHLASFLKTGENLQVKGLVGNDNNAFFSSIKLPTNDVTLMPQAVEKVVPVNSCNTHSKQYSTHPTSSKRLKTDSFPASTYQYKTVLKEETDLLQAIKVESTEGNLTKNDALFGESWNVEEDINRMLYSPEGDESSQQLSNENLLHPSETNKHFSKLQFIRSSRGLFQLVFDGFVFNRNGAGAGSVYWKCIDYSSRGCKGRCKTNDNGGLVFSGEHNHNMRTKKLLNKRIYSVEDVNALNAVKENGFEGASFLGE